MKKLIANFVFFIFGWKSKYKEGMTEKCVVIAAPHTSNWDFVFAMALYWKHGITIKFFIKNEYMKGLLGYFFKKIGAIGVRRGKKNNLVDFAVNLFKENEKLVLIVPVEATRKKVGKWKKGFYVIAKQANVPVALGYLDFKKKHAGIGEIFHLSDSFEDDMEKIQDFYKDISGKNPENYNPKIY